MSSNEKLEVRPFVVEYKSIKLTLLMECEDPDFREMMQSNKAIRGVVQEKLKIIWELNDDQVNGCGCSGS